MSTHPDLSETEREWKARCNALIACGWGDVPEYLLTLDGRIVRNPDLPWNWRDERGPDRSFSAEGKANVSAAVSERWRKSSPVVCKPRAKRGSLKKARLDAAAEQMRTKYLTARRAGALLRWARGITDAS